MNTAHAQLEIRSVDDEQRIFEGVVSSSAVDTYGTVVEPRGAVYTLPLPFHWHHRKHEPVGTVIASEVKADGKRWATVHIPRIEDDGTEGGRDVKRRVDSAWADIKNGLVRGLSIEFDPIEPRSRTAKRWTQWRWLGLGGVTIPSNMDATIVAIRSADEAVNAATSPGVSGTLNGRTSPGVSGTNATKRRGPMTILEQIKDHEASRAAKVAQKEALMTRAAEAGRTLDEAESEEFDTLDTEIRSHDGHLTRLNSLKRDNERAAQPVNGQSSQAATQSRGTGETQQLSNGQTQTRSGVPVVRVHQDEEPGLGYARYVMALVASNGNRYEAAEYARQTWGERGEGVALMHRAAVAAGTTTNATFAAPLVQTNYLQEFLELLRPKTLIGRIQGFQRVPFNVQMTVQTAGGSYSWVGQGVGKPVTNLQVAPVTLGIAKAAGIIVISEELARSSTPSAQEVVRNELIKGMQQYLDGQLVDPAVAAVANVSPASITNGVTGTAASGTTEAAARADLRALIGGFDDDNLDISELVLLMKSSVAFALGTMVNAVGGTAFPGLSVDGGSILNVPVVTSNTVGNRIIAVHAPSVMFADDGGTEISVSREASIIMDSAPATVVQATGAAPIHTSLWQNNLVGLRAERWINWGKARANAVDMITGVAYA